MAKRERKATAAKQLANRIRKSVKRTGAPGLEEELEDLVGQAQSTLLEKVSITLGVSMDACLGRNVRREFVKVSPFVAEHLERIRNDMPFLGDNLDQIADYVFKKFIGDGYGYGVRRERK